MTTATQARPGPDAGPIAALREMLGTAAVEAMAVVGAPSPAAAGPAPASTSSAVGEHLMDRVYRHQRHFYDVTRKYFLLGRDVLIARLDPPPGGTILEIGCGTGRNLIQVALAYPDATVFGLDVSSEMLSTARANIRMAGLESKIRLGLGDAAAFDSWSLFRRVAFDRVFFSYSLSMIPPWEQALKAGHAVVEPIGGRLLAVDFSEQTELPAAFKRLLFGFLAHFHVTPRHELQAALGRLAAASGGRVAAASLYRDYAQLAELAR